jgi:hypothetical protein
MKINVIDLNINNFYNYMYIVVVNCYKAHEWLNTQYGMHLTFVDWCIENY